METFIGRFPHIAIQIFEQLNDESLKKCREVTKHWQQFIDDKNLSWTRIVEIPVQKGKSTYLKLAFKTGQINVLKTILEKTENEILKTSLLAEPVLSVQSRRIKTKQNEILKKLNVRLACEYAHTWAAEWLIQNSLVLDIDLKNDQG